MNASQSPRVRAMKVRAAITLITQAADDWDGGPVAADYLNDAIALLSSVLRGLDAR